MVSSLHKCKHQIIGYISDSESKNGNLNKRTLMQCKEIKAGSLWGYCLVGYFAGRFPVKAALLRL